CFLRLSAYQSSQVYFSPFVCIFSLVPSLTLLLCLFSCLFSYLIVYPLSVLYWLFFYR
ncbi:hypothetical protein EDC96DRAFT_530266, partial [Choanephora cucurbitarum]